MGSCSLGAEDWICSGRRGLGRLGGLGKGLGVGMIDALCSGLGAGVLGEREMGWWDLEKNMTMEVLYKSQGWATPGTVELFYLTTYEDKTNSKQNETQYPKTIKEL